LCFTISPSGSIISSSIGFPNKNPSNLFTKYCADLDEESDTEHGQVGQIAKTLLLPHYNVGEKKFLDKKLSLRSAIRTYYNAPDQKIKEHPIASYNEKEGNAYTKTVMDFIKD
jgi:hypothetical protein